MSLLAETIGLRAVRQLAPDFGGRTLRIPTMSDNARSVALRARIVELIGPEQAANLITALGGLRVYVPINFTGKFIRPDPALIARLYRRKSAHAIAKQLGCSERVIYRKLAEHRLRITRRKS